MKAKGKNREALTREATERLVEQRISHVAAGKATAPDPERARPWMASIREVVLLPSQEAEVRKAAQKQFDALHGAMFSSPPVVGYAEESLVNLAKLCAETSCYAFNKICGTDFLRVVVERMCKEQNLGFEQLRQLRHSLKIIGEALMQEEKRQKAAAPIVPPRDGKLGPIDGHVIVRLHIFHQVRNQGDSYLSSDEVLNTFRKTIKKLPPLAKDPKAWGHLINEMTWSDPRHSRHLEPGGSFYEAIVARARALRLSEQRKQRKSFWARYRLLPLDFLKMSHEERLAVVEESLGSDDPRGKRTAMAAELATEIERGGIPDNDLKVALLERIYARIKKEFR